MATGVRNHFTQAWLNQLLQRPGTPLEGKLDQSPYKATIVIANFKQRISSHFKTLLPNGLDAFCHQIGIPWQFQHFGILINFERPTELILHDDDRTLDDGLRFLMAQTGPVIIRNAYLSIKHRGYGHRNRFPHLNFHVDRSADQPDHYSMYTRDPTDPEQIQPRTVSTLLTAKIVGHLQAIKEGIVKSDDVGIKYTYTVFTKEVMDNICGELIIDQPWDEPEGTGEIAMQDNLTCLHASYYRDDRIKGYRIGVRYLS